MPENKLSATIKEWTLGLGNMVHKENHAWYGTKKLMVQCIVWTAVITGCISLVLYVFSTLPAAVRREMIDSYGVGAAALQLFFNITGFAAVIGVIILTHDLIISERVSGTAEWILSKPLSRKAFVLSKLVSSMVWITAVIIILQGLLLLVVVHFFGGEIDYIPFMKGLGLIWLICFFYTSMLMFMGTVTTSRGIALGAGLVFFLSGHLFPMLVPELYYVMPWKLSEIAFSMSMSIAWSAKIFLPIAMTVLWSLLFIAGALWRIEAIEI